MRIRLACAVAAIALLAGFDAGAAANVITYRADDSLIVLPVRLGSLPPQWFCLDSGSAHTVIDPRLAKLLALKTVAAGAVGGTGKGRVVALTGAPIDLFVGGLRVHAANPWIIDLRKVPIAPDIGGLLGYDLFAAQIVEIDPEEQTLSTYDFANYAPPVGSIAVPLIVKDNKLYIDAVLDVKPGLSVTHRLRIDTGSNDSVNDAVVSQALSVRSSTLGNGLGENFTALSGMLDAIHIGPFTIHHIWGSGAPGPSIGMTLLHRFTMAFDVRAGRLYLKPNKYFPRTGS